MAADRLNDAGQLVRSVIRKLQSSFDALAAKVAARWSFTSALYYAFCSTAFAREHRSVLQGRLRYSRDVKEPQATSALLRRNVHRLEKGLLMQPRRPVFALDYIGETIEAYAVALGSPREGGGVAPEELQWAHDVLGSYFEACQTHSDLKELRLRYARLPEPSAQLQRPTTPYKRDLSGPPPVLFEQFQALAERRRSVRWFLRQPVPREVLDRAVVAAGLSPSACNRQPFVFRIFDDPALVQKVAAIPFGTEGYRENIPVIIVVVGRLRCFFHERDRHLIYIDGSLAAMSLAFALESSGLSTCLINWPDLARQERKMAAQLRLAPDERPIMLMAVGYPDPNGLVAASIKKPLEELRIYNQA